ncbi:MAG: response regulator, partial [Deltaproteobacteria bacterium]|nr:response regulator [Deltaproteobacteria bacterium]
MNTLIVDDELVSRKTIQKIMMSFGECEAVESGSEAVTAFKQALENGATFNFITLDVTMPEMDGTEVLYEIRNIENEMKIPNENRVKILMVTSQADKETVITCIQAGCDDYITKPFDKGKLMVKLERMGLVVTKEIEEKGDLQAMTKETVKRFERDEIDLNVLIVDDLGNVRGLLRTLLKKLGGKQFHEATNGLEALRI